MTCRKRVYTSKQERYSMRGKKQRKNYPSINLRRKLSQSVLRRCTKNNTNSIFCYIRVAIFNNPRLRYLISQVGEHALIAMH
jgi:hypothetical protein